MPGTNRSSSGGSVHGVRLGLMEGISASTLPDENGAPVASCENVLKNLRSPRGARIADCATRRCVRRWAGGAGIRRALCDRIRPAQAGEAGEIRVGRLQLALMLDRQRRQVRVRRQVAGSAERVE